MNSSTAFDSAAPRPGELPGPDAPGQPAVSEPATSDPGARPLKHPLLYVVLYYAAGILAGWRLGGSPFVLLAAALCASVLALLSLTRVCSLGCRCRGWVLPGLLVLAGWTNYTLHTAVLSPHDLRRILGSQPRLVTLRGKLIETPPARLSRGRRPWHSQARLAVSALGFSPRDWRPATGTVAVATPELLTNFFAGQTVEITGVVAPPPGPEAEGLFDYRAFLEQQGVYYHLQTESDKDWRLLDSPARPPLADRFRDWGRRTLALGLPVEDESLRLEWALTLGWKTALTEEVCEPFIKAATYHIFAVDGLRMAIIFGILFSLLRALGLPRSVIGLLSWPVLWFYVALTGWPASAIRATVMLSVVTLGWVLKRPWNPLNSLFAAAGIILLCQPQQLFQAGFQLSFFVVLCLILLLPPLSEGCARLAAPDPLLPEELYPGWRKRFKKPLRFAGDLLVTSFAAWIGSLPLVAYYFNLITPVSTPANLPAVPLCGLVLVCNLSSLLVAGWFPRAAELFNHAGWFLMECIRVSSHWFANWPGACFYVPAPTSGLYYGLLLALVTGWLLKPVWRAARIGLLSLAVAAWLAQEWREWTTTRLALLPSGGAMAIYVDAPGWKNDFLLDCGNTNTVNSLLKPFLRAQGVNRLGRLALTHGDIHHVGGAELAAELFAVRQIAVGPARFRSGAYRRIVDNLGRRTNRVETLSRGKALGTWSVLHPEAGDRFPRADDNALVLRAPPGQGSLLLLSDLGRPGQDTLRERTPDLRSEIVIAGLPAIGEALGDALLEAIQPRLIIVADAEFPATERAGQKLIERLSRRGVPVLYTRFSGAVTLEWRGKDWTLRSARGLRFDRQSIPPPKALEEMARGDYLAKQAAQFDRQIAKPTPFAFAFVASLVFAGAVFGVYELVGFGISKVANRADDCDQVS